MKGELGNIVGPQIRKRRYSLGWSQARLAVKLQLVGFDISRESLAKVEIQIHKVEDYQLPYYARALNVQLAELFPPLPLDRPINDTIVALRVKRNGSKAVVPVNGSATPTNGARGQVNGHAHLNGSHRSIEQKEQMTLPVVQLRAEPK